MSTSESNSPSSTDAPASEETPVLQLEVDIKSPSACERHVTVTVSRPDIDRYFDEAVGEMMTEANVPGFRPGRAPRKLVESHFRRELTDKIKGSLLMDAMSQVADDEDFSAISEPDFDFDAVEIPADGPLTFEFNIEVRPEFDMPRWKGLALEKPNRAFGKKEIDGHLVKLLERHAILEPVDEPAELEDFVVVDLKFLHNDKQIAELKDAELRIRPDLSFEDGTLPGFGKLMVGTQSGAKRTATLAISPQAENEALRGEEVTVEIDVLDVKRLVPPRITDDLLAKLGDFENEGDLRDAVENELQRQLGYHQNRAFRRQITALLTESADWGLPPDLLQRQARRELERAVMELRSSGFSDEQIRAHVNVLRQNSEETTATALKEHFILERIAEEEEIEATDADYDQEIMMMAMQSGESPRSVRARIDKQGLMDALRNQIVEGKAIQRITEEAKFTDIPFQPDQTTTTAVEFAIGGTSAAEIPDAKHGGDQRELQQRVDRS